jgi:hypothetical protein
MLRIGNEDTPVRFTAAFVIPDTIATAVKERLPNLDDNPEFLGINCSTDYSIQTVGYEYRWTDGEFPVSGIESTRP